jgi:hypothetical protein
MKAKMSAAEERRQKIITETKEKAAISASPARGRGKKSPMILSFSLAYLTGTLPAPRRKSDCMADV